LVERGVQIDGMIGPRPTGPGGDPAGDAVEPPGDCSPATDGGGLAGEGEEGGLAGILGGVVVVEHRAAGAKNHSGISPDEQFEGGLIPLAGEPGEQVGVSGPVGGQADGSPQVIEDGRNSLG
jgi:hypothetical protein